MCGFSTQSNFGKVKISDLAICLASFNLNHKQNENKCDITVKYQLQKHYSGTGSPGYTAFRTGARGERSPGLEGVLLPWRTSKAAFADQKVRKVSLHYRDVCPAPCAAKAPGKPSPSLVWFGFLLFARPVMWTRSINKRNERSGQMSRSRIAWIPACHVEHSVSKSRAHQNESSLSGRLYKSILMSFLIPRILIRCTYTI